MKKLIEFVKSLPFSVIVAVGWLLMIVGMLVLIFPSVAFGLAFAGVTVGAVWRVASYLDKREQERRLEAVEKGLKKRDWGAFPPR